MSPSLLTSSAARLRRAPKVLGGSAAGTLALVLLLGACGPLPDQEQRDASAPVAAAEADPAEDTGEETSPEETEPSDAPDEPAEANTESSRTERTSEPEPETEPAAEPPAEPEPVEPQSFSGAGSEVVILEPLGEDVFFANATYDGSGNFAVWSVDENGQDIDLLVNHIGDYDGQIPVNFSEDPAAFRVEAEGAWSIDLVPLGEAPRWDGASAYEATGDAIVIVDGVAEGLTPVRLTHDGESNFAIWAWGESYPDLIVNDIGTYDGTTLLPDGTLVLQVDADGNWTIEVE